MIVDATAEYIPDGDTVLARAYVYSPEEDTYHPEQVKSGTAKLLNMGVAIAPVATFDRRMGNADGSFKFVFSHPLKTTNLEFEVYVVLLDDTSYAKRVTVQLDPEHGSEAIPLAGQQMQPPIDQRSKIRDEEESL